MKHISSALLAVLISAACTDNGNSDDGGSTGGTSGTGTGASGGVLAGSAGAGVTGGASGVATGGAATGGAATGGAATGGAATGGAATGGAAAGGSAGAATGGSAGTNGGSAGASGTSGATGGASGASGSGGSSGLYTCPAGVTGMPLPATPMVTRITSVPPNMFGTSSSSNVEGPVWVDGALYVSHIQEGGENPPPSRILKVTGTTTEEFLLLAGTNGLAVNAMGNIVGARHTSGDVAALNLATKMFTPIAGMYMSARFNTPNDLAIRRDGNIYFTDPDFQAPPSRPQTQTRVYRSTPTGSVSVVDAAISNPNGISLSLDENTLFVSTSGNLYRYPVMADGSTGSGMMMNGAPGSDGMVLDCAGNLYLTDGNGHRVVVVTSSGGMVGTISMGIPNEAEPTNVAFGGTDHRRLFITTRGSGANGAGLYYIDLNIPGMPY